MTSQPSEGADDLGMRRADCGCCYVVDAVALNSLRTRFASVEELARWWDSGPTKHRDTMTREYAAAKLRCLIEGSDTSGGVRRVTKHAEDVEAAIYRALGEIPHPMHLTTTQKGAVVRMVTPIVERMVTEPEQRQ